MNECTLKLEHRLLKPGTEVMLGASDDKVRGTIYRVEITITEDQYVEVLYHVEWWVDRVVYRSGFMANDLEAV